MVEAAPFLLGPPPRGLCRQDFDERSLALIRLGILLRGDFSFRQKDNARERHLVSLRLKATLRGVASEKQGARAGPMDQQ